MKTAILTVDDKKYELPIIEGSEGERAVDIQTLRAKSGLITFDPAYGNTGSCTSGITFINGEEGILRYRGIPIEEFDVENPNFLEVAWLLIFGRLPNKEELNRFSQIASGNAHIPESMKHHFQGFPSNAPPMAILSGMINSLSCFHPEYFNLDTDASFENVAGAIMSKIRTIAAFSYRSSLNLPFIYPNNNLKYAANLLHMMFSMPYKDAEIDKDFSDALNLIFILHADHEQNCGTSTVRMVGSARTNLLASVASGVCSLWGALHGGANMEVIKMLDEIHEGDRTPEDCIKMAKEKDSKFKLMGFGHRVYKNFDPRAKILKKACDKVFAKLKIKDSRLDIARKLEELALADSYFKEKKLFPNVDFYSGILLRAIGIPTNMFTVFFAIGRLPGWIAQWREQHNGKNTRICRPRQVYTGKTVTKYVPLENR